MSEQNTKVSYLKERDLQPTGKGKDNRMTRLQLSMVYNSLRIAGDVGNEWASAILPIPEAFNMFISIQRAAMSKEPYTESFDGVRGAGNNQQVESTVVIGRDDQGIVYLQIAAASGKSQRYNFLPAPGRNWKINGQPMPVNEQSRRTAMSWVDTMRAIIPEDYANNYTDRATSNNGGGGNGNWKGGGGGYKGGGNNNWKGGGGYKGGGNNNWNNNQQAQQQQYQPAPQPQNENTPDPLDFENYTM